MGRHQSLDQAVRNYHRADAWAVQHGCEIVPCNGAHVKIVKDGRLIAVHTTHGEPGPHTRSALHKALAPLLLLLVPLACGLAALVVRMGLR